MLTREFINRYTQAEAYRMELVGHSDLNGFGDVMQMMLKDSILYVGHMGSIAMSLVDVSNPARPKVIRQFRNYGNTKSPKVQTAGNLMLVNYEQRGTAPPERAGVGLFDISDPVAPRELGYFETGGKGVHRMDYTGGRYAYLSAEPRGYRGRILIIIDVSDPERPTEVSRWWWPGQKEGETPTWPAGLRYMLHHPIVRGNRAYMGYWDGGLVILDLSDIERPRLVSGLQWAPEGGGASHTALPLRDGRLLAVTDEAISDYGAEPPKRIRLIDIEDETQPRVVAFCPAPQGDYAGRGLWSGPHNLHENRPGTYVSDRYIFATYFNAGVRVYDVSDPQYPQEVAYYVPPTPSGQEAIQLNDILVSQDGLIFVGDRLKGGLYILRPNLDL